MNKNRELKDLLYYNDLIYKIKSLAGMPQKENPLVENRIWQREAMIKEIKENDMVTYSFSPFQEDVFKIIREISKKANVSFKNLYEIHKYPNIVKEELITLYKQNELYTDYLMTRPTPYTKLEGQYNKESYKLVKKHNYNNK